MINVAKLITGEYVEATSNISDFAKPGDVFKIIWNRIPGDEGKALAWKVNPKTCAQEGSESYPLPHDAIGYLNRSVLAKILKSQLKKLEDQKRKLDTEIGVILSRSRNIENTESSEDEQVVFMRAAFDFL